MDGIERRLIFGMLDLEGYPHLQRHVAFDVCILCFWEGYIVILNGC